MIEDLTTFEAESEIALGKVNAAALSALLDRLRSAPHFLLTAHARPDGDAVGSLLALGMLLSALGITSDIVLADPVPSIYCSLPGVERIRHATRVDADDANGSLAPCILLECDSLARTGLVGLEHRSLINIDHHASGRSFASLNWIDSNACAVGAMIYQLARAARVEITPDIATCLYTAIISDTGAFTYQGTSAETLALAAELARCGAEPGRIARDVFFSNPESKMRILGVALTHLQREGTIAWSWVTLSDMEHVGAVIEDCEGVVNYLIGIDGVESAVFLRQAPGGEQYRLSIRSKGKVDVARVAEYFDGGGHRTASGCTLDGPLEVASARILAQLQQELW